MANRFPKDCWKKSCPHFHTRDLSVDDLVCTCDLLKIQCDACDEAFCLYLCPLPNEPKGWGEVKENLIHRKPTEVQYMKFERINAKTEDEKDSDCHYYNDCSICPYAVHQELYSTIKHTCVQGMTRHQFEIAMDNADCYF